MSSGRGTIGNPTSSAGEGIAHPRGRFDVSKKTAGYGSEELTAELAGRLALSKTVDEATKMGVLRPVAEEYFAMENPSYISEPRARTGESVRNVLKR